MSDKPPLIGYVTVRAFGGFRIPVPVQNLVLRNYAQGLQMRYALPQGEHKYPGSFMQLFTTVMDASPGDHVGMCSATMLPTRREMKASLFEIVSAKNLTLHFVFERIVVHDDDELSKLSNNLRLSDEVRRARGGEIAGELRDMMRGRL